MTTGFRVIPRNCMLELREKRRIPRFSRNSGKTTSVGKELWARV